MPCNRRTFLTRSAPLLASTASVAGLAGCSAIGRGPAAGASGGDASGGDVPTATGASWVSGPAMPEARTEVSAATLDGEVYVVGGLVPDGETAGVLALDPGSGVDVAGEWRTVASLPAPRHHVPVAVAGGRLYAIGGFEGGFTPQETVFVYDPATDEWTGGPTLPEPRGAAGAAVIDGTVFVAGGVTPDGVVGSALALDVGTDGSGDATWRQPPAMPTAREHLAAGAVGGRLIVAGGRRGFGNAEGATEVYEPGSEEWTEGAALPTPRGGVGGTGFDGRLVVLGGESPRGTFDEVEAYDPAADEWVAFPPLPTARHGLGVVALDGRLYAISGGPEPGATYSSVVEVLETGGG